VRESVSVRVCERERARERGRGGMTDKEKETARERVRAVSTLSAFGWYKFSKAICNDDDDCFYYFQK